MPFLSLQNRGFGFLPTASRLLSSGGGGCGGGSSIGELELSRCCEGFGEKDEEWEVEESVVSTKDEGCCEGCCEGCRVGGCKC